jgi:hypothetical protein
LIGAMIRRPRLLGKAAADSTYSVLDKSDLATLRLRAVRSGAWFRALVRIDRVLVDLALKVVPKIQSGVLIAALTAVAKKLEAALKNKMELATEKYGFELALRAGLAAQRLGHKSSGSWAVDRSFARFLAVMYINSSNPSWS